jgi:hypothetical protein
LHQDPLRLHLPDYPADVATQVEAGNQRAVGIPQKSNIVDADPLGCLGLLGPSYPGDLIARKFEVGAAGVTVGADAIDDLEAGVGRRGVRLPQGRVRSQHRGGAVSARAPS